MTDVVMTDKTGEPRDIRDARDALVVIEKRLTNPTALIADPELGVHMMTIRDILRTYIRGEVMKRCRHRSTWIIAGGSYEWCYACGSLRNMSERGIADCVPTSPWCRPSGSPHDNPFSEWNKRRNRYRMKQLQKREAGKAS